MGPKPDITGEGVVSFPDPTHRKREMCVAVAWHHMVVSTCDIHTCTILGSQGQKPLHTYGLMNISVSHFCSLQPNHTYVVA